MISLIKNEVKGCLGCNVCRYGKPCIQKDSFNDMIPKIKSADCIVFASPLYFWTISARIKAFIERFYCIAEEEILLAGGCGNANGKPQIVEVQNGFKENQFYMDNKFICNRRYNDDVSWG